MPCKIHGDVEEKEVERKKSGLLTSSQWTAREFQDFLCVREVYSLLNVQLVS